MKTTESITTYQGRVQQLTQILAGTVYDVTESNLWRKVTKGLLNLYKPSVWMVKISFERSRYHERISKLQEIAQKDVGDTIISLERKRKAQFPSAALSTVEERRRKKPARGVKIICNWCQKLGQMKHECKNKKAGKPQFLPKYNGHRRKITI